MKKNATKVILSLMLISFTMISCKQQKSNSQEETPVDKEITKENIVNNITLEKLQDSPTYTDAVLQMDTPKNGKITEGDEIDFAFTVNNYELGAQTESLNTELLANSGKGQHIHFILNNQPYSAHYDPTFKKEIPNGVHHLVAFLSRSYHESVKNKNSVVVKKLQVGADTQDTNLNMDTPTLIYSRPKGEYTGKATENLLLDFFVLNTTLSENGNKVKATINESEFLITEWAPYIIKGLSMGKVTIKLELINTEGNLIDGPFNEVVRTVILKK